MFWDNFIIDGYIVIFQVSIILLDLFEENLLPLSFEEMLNYIVDIPKVLFSKNGEEEGILESENISDEESKEYSQTNSADLSPLKEGKIKEILKNIDFPSLLANSPVSQELIDKIEAEYKDNEIKGNFN